MSLSRELENEKVSVQGVPNSRRSHGPQGVTLNFFDDTAQAADQLELNKDMLSEKTTPKPSCQISERQVFQSGSDYKPHELLLYHGIPRQFG